MVSSYRQAVEISGSTSLPGPAGEVMMFKVTATTTATRLGTLITIPTVKDVETSSYVGQPETTRPPRTVSFQLPIGATNLVYLGIDNVVTPVAGDGGPGIELQKGLIYTFDNVAPLLAAKTGEYAVSVGSAFQLVARTGSQDLSVWFTD